MGLKNDQWIHNMAVGHSMISPFMDGQVTSLGRIIKHNHDGSYEPIDKVISYGLSSYGYDMRVAGEFKVFTNFWPGIIDPKNFEAAAQFHEVVSEDYVVIPPNSFALARSVEYFRIPRSVMCIVIGKSTYARCGIVCKHYGVGAGMGR